MRLLLFPYLLSKYQAWLKDERAYLDSSRSRSARYAPVLKSLPFSTKLNLSHELEIGKDMLWSDTRSARKRSGFDLAKNFPIPPKTYSWSTGKEEGTTFYTLKLGVHLGVASESYTLGLVGCEAYGECDHVAFGSILNSWRISSPVSKEDREWKDILSKVIPHSASPKRNHHSSLLKKE
ncbi:hypothetical protein DSO57_1023568 [Entomophthora muscae]|uniref:Uncharacterized protein n=1 Tax=Entomophthora muscae TaxID=34485 RepID=A0ACC2SFF3_9FUNG|nr:hypothetical protein DSO57_1023568 [Entomophthora muscae]